jgi:hypothetical protein
LSGIWISRAWLLWTVLGWTLGCRGLCCNLIKSFLCLLRSSCDSCPCFCLWLCKIYQFAFAELSLHFWNETNLIMAYDCCNMLLNSTCKIFIEHFCIWVHQGYWSTAFFLCVLTEFWHQGILAS